MEALFEPIAVFLLKVFRVLGLHVVWAVVFALLCVILFPAILILALTGKQSIGSLYGDLRIWWYCRKPTFDERISLGAESMEKRRKHEREVEKERLRARQNRSA